MPVAVRGAFTEPRGARAAGCAKPVSMLAAVWDVRQHEPALADGLLEPVDEGELVYLGVMVSGLASLRRRPPPQGVIQY